MVFPVAVVYLAINYALMNHAFDVSDAVAGFLLTVSTSVAVVALAWVTQSVRCPSCGARLLWMALREQPAGRWMSWLDSLLLCPVCGSAGDTPDRPR